MGSKKFIEFKIDFLINFLRGLNEIKRFMAIKHNICIFCLIFLKKI